MKFDSKPIVEHPEVPLADAGRLEEIVTHWQGRETPIERRDHQGKNACYVVSMQDDYSANQLNEILSLVKTQGDTIVGHELIRQIKPEPRAFFTKGKSRAIAEHALACGADLLVVDAELSPSQMRNLEDSAGIAVCDREAIILNVFLQHAKTRSARIQVEIAHLEYLRPRIRGLGLDMDQQAGGVMLGRGPGETASELMARRLDGRLTELRKAFRKIQKSSDLQRQSRKQCKRIVLVGYTNAGKTSIMNALTRAELSAKDKPFETLDTTTRCLSRHGSHVLISDTVGFIRRLPQRLFASFASTLGEIAYADLLLIVVDISDPEHLLQIQTTESVLDQLAAAKIPRLYIFNKTDLLTDLDQTEMHLLSRGHPFLTNSCLQDNTSVLQQAVLQQVRQEIRRYRIFVPYSETRALKKIYGQSRVLSSEAQQLGLALVIETSQHIVMQLEKQNVEVCYE